MGCFDHLHLDVQAHDLPARPPGLAELLHLLAAQQVASQNGDGNEGEQDVQLQEAYTQSRALGMHIACTPLIDTGYQGRLRDMIDTGYQGRLRDMNRVSKSCEPRACVS